MSHPVVEDRVGAGAVHHDDEEGHAEQAPAHGVARLARGDDKTDKNRHDAESGQDRRGGGKLTGVGGKQEIDDTESSDQHRQGDSGLRGCQPIAPPGDIAPHRLVPDIRLLHLATRSDATP